MPVLRQTPRAFFAPFFVLVVLLAPNCGRINFQALDDDAGPGVDAGFADASFVDAAPATPMVIATGTFPYLITADSTHVYWTDFAAGSLHRFPIAGGSVEALTPPEAGTEIYGLAVAGDFVYLCDSASGELRRVASTGGSIEVLATSPCFDIAVDATHLYWSSKEPNEPTIRRLALTSGTLEDIGAPGVSYNIELAGSTLYWTVYSLGEIHSIPTIGGTSSRLATVAASGPWGLTADTTSVYWANHQASAGSIARVPINGGPAEILASDQAGAHQVVVEGQDVYWTSEYDGTIMHQGQGVAPVAIATGQGEPLGLALTAEALFWTNETGNVMRLDR